MGTEVINKSDERKDDVLHRSLNCSCCVSNGDSLIITTVMRKLQTFVSVIAIGEFILVDKLSSKYTHVLVKA